MLKRQENLPLTNVAQSQFMGAVLTEKIKKMINKELTVQVMDHSQNVEFMGVAMIKKLKK